jgi:hypothetical protein
MSPALNQQPLRPPTCSGSCWITSGTAWLTTYSPGWSKEILAGTVIHKSPLANRAAIHPDRKRPEACHTLPWSKPDSMPWPRPAVTFYEAHTLPRRIRVGSRRPVPRCENTQGPNVGTTGPPPWSNQPDRADVEVDRVGRPNLRVHRLLRNHPL